MEDQSVFFQINDEVVWSQAAKESDGIHLTTRLFLGIGPFTGKSTSTPLFRDDLNCQDVQIACPKGLALNYNLIFSAKWFEKAPSKTP